MRDTIKQAPNAFFQEDTVRAEDPIMTVRCRQVKPNPFQPRRYFDEQALDELARSIAIHGILQPIIVRKNKQYYEIVAGERRFRASQLAGLQEVPVIVRDFDEKEMMELALLENLQRENLTPIEEAEAYEALIQHLGFTQEQLAERVGKSRPHIANHLRLLKLPQTVRNFVDSGELSMGHGRALAGVKSATQIEQLAQLALAKKLNVRQLEQLVKERAPKNKVKRSTELQAVEAILQESLGTKVTIRRSKKKGTVEIDFYSSEELQQLVDKLLGEE